MLDQVLHKSNIPLPSCHHEGCLLILQSSATKVIHYSSHFIICNHTNPKPQNILAVIAERISTRLWIEDLFSWSTYVHTCVRTYVHGGSCSGMSRGMLLHTIDIGRPYAGICASLSLTFRYARLRYWLRTTAFFDDGGGGRGRRCSGAIAVWIQRTPNTAPTAIVTCATRASPAPGRIYNVSA